MAKVRLLIGIPTPRWAEGRRATLARLLDQLGGPCDGVDVVVHEHDHQNGLIACHEALQRCLDMEPEFFCGISDDAILIPDFVQTCLNIIAARPDDIIDMLSNHTVAVEAHAKGCDWYRSEGGFLGIGGMMRTEMWREMLAWRQEKLNSVSASTLPIDECVNLWAMLTGRHVYKPLPSPLQHDVSIGSLLGNDQPESFRTSHVFDGKSLAHKDWTGDVYDVGRTVVGQHWQIATCLRYTESDLDRMYEVARR